MVAASAAAPTATPASSPASPASTVATSVPAHRPRPRRARFCPAVRGGTSRHRRGFGHGQQGRRGRQRKAAEPFAAAAAAAGGRASNSGRATPAGGAARVRSRVYGNECQCRSVTGAGRRRIGDRDGAGPLGFAGTVAKRALAAAGLATLSDDDFGGGAGDADAPGHVGPDAGQTGDAGQGGEHD